MGDRVEGWGKMSGRVEKIPKAESDVSMDECDYYVALELLMSITNKSITHKSYMYLISHQNVSVSLYYSLS